MSEQKPISNDITKVSISNDTNKPREFLTRPAVIDWLQWGKFPDILGTPDMPQVTLSLLAEFKTAYEAVCKERDELAKKLEGKRKLIDLQYTNHGILSQERDKLRAELEAKLDVSEQRDRFAKRIGELEASLAVAVEFIEQFKECRCPEAWIHRQRHAPECVADEVEEVFAKIKGEK